MPARLVFRDRWGGENVGRHDALDEVVEPGEVVGAPGDADDALVEQDLEGELGVVPVPPRTRVADPSLDITNGDRAPSAHLVEDALQHPRMPLREMPCVATVGQRLHPPSKQREVLRRHQRGDVGPVLEQLAGGDGIGDQRARVRAEASEQGEFLAAYEDVDGVDLDQPDVVEHAAQVLAGDTAGRAWPGEPLGCEGDASGRVSGEARGHARSPARSGITTSVTVLVDRSRPQLTRSDRG